MVDFLLRVVLETWSILKEASVFLLFGFVLAGVLATVVPARLLSRLFGTGKVKSVLWGAAIGAPLPLCSCGVLPTALALRRQGATPGATVSFLISTPETGVDSISVTYALMDPINTVFRPVTAVITSITAGLATNFLGIPKSRAEAADVSEHPSASAGSQGDIALVDLGGHHDHAHQQGDVHGHDHEPVPAADPIRDSAEGGRAAAIRRAVGRIYHYAFRQLLDETSYWLVLGIVLSGVIAAAVPSSLFEHPLMSGFWSMIVMLFIGIPTYTCASASTPVAAALVMKGLNPGAALVYLLAGPATSMSSMVVLTRFLGVRIVAIYLASIAVVALFAGYALNWVYRTLEVDPRATFGAATAFIPEWLKIAGALVLIALLLASVRRTHVPGEWTWLRDRFAVLTGLRVSAARLARGSLATAVVLYVGSGLFTVQPGEVGVGMRFGQIVSPTLAPGLHYRLPWPFGPHHIIPKDRVQRIEYNPAARPQVLPVVIPPSRTGWGPVPGAAEASNTWFQREAVPDELFLLTGDGNLIDLRWAVQYRIEDAVAYAFRIAEPDVFVRSASLAALRSVIARIAIDELYTSQRSGVEQQVAHAIQRSLNTAGAGIRVLSFHLLYVHAPSEVHDAFRDVASAQEDKLRTINRAHTFAVETVNQAKGEAAAMMEQALAFKEQQVLHAQGDAAGFLLRLGAYRRAPELTRFRLQMEAIEATLPGLPKFITPDAKEMQEFDMWLLQPVGPNRSR
jgi:HflK protein